MLGYTMVVLYSRMVLVDDLSVTNVTLYEFGVHFA